MSASTIARWKAIPLEREERPRSPAGSNEHVDNDNDEDDNVSLLSRSPSPPPQQSGEGKTGTEWYDDHVRGIAREVITIETKIKPTNVGFALLKKMGWTEGTGLGMSGEGRPDPIPFSVKYDNTGLGKAAQDFRVIESTVANRRELDSERQSKETEEQRANREAKVAQRAAIKTEVAAAIRPFYCELCDKQYQNVAQFDEHVRGYAHTHKLRFKEMQATQRAKNDTEKRKEKERKREEKEMRKLAAAAGIKLPNPKVNTPATTTPAISDGSMSEDKPKSGWASVSTASGPASKGGWSTVSTTTANNSNPSGGSGWAAVKQTDSTPKSGGWSLTTSPSTPTAASGGGWKSVSSFSAPESGDTPTSATSPAPKPSSAFVSGGWTRLETSVESDVPPQATGVTPATSRTGWSTVTSSMHTSGSIPEPPAPSSAPPPPPDEDVPMPPQSPPPPQEPAPRPPSLPPTPTPGYGRRSPDREWDASKPYNSARRAEPPYDKYTPDLPGRHPSGYGYGAGRDGASMVPARMTLVKGIPQIVTTVQEDGTAVASEGGTVDIVVETIGDVIDDGTMDAETLYLSGRIFGY
ncbi:hypothetical protein FRB99_004333 [Tulasnella sp. 403]|nr:hypothetical protein FRB99_004333 [Tulasnella sp. 403]